MMTIDLGRDFVRRVQQIEAGAARHLDVGDHDVEVVLLEVQERAVSRSPAVTTS